MQKMPSILAWKGAVLTLSLALFASCNFSGGGNPPTPAAKTANPPEIVRRIVPPPALEKSFTIFDFESPDDRFFWKSAPADTLPTTAGNAPATPRIPADTLPTSAGDLPATLLARTTHAVEHGLWALRAPISHAGSIERKLDKPLPVQDFDTFSVQVMQDSPRANADLAAAVLIEDSHGNRFVGDFYLVTTKWFTVPLDLHYAAEHSAVDLSAITTVGVALRPSAKVVAPIEFMTDTWALSASKRIYWPIPAADSAATPSPKSFYIRREGGALRIGQGDQWQLTFHKRAGQDRAWLEVTRGRSAQVVMGQQGTGLMILDQEAWNGLEKAVQRTPITAEALAAIGDGVAPTYAWPGSAGDTSTWDWRVAWTSAVAAQVDVKQTSGSIDELGRPAVVIDWKFTVYRSGQVYVHARWNRQATGTPDPVSWAMVLPNSTINMAQKPPERLLTELYPRQYRADTMPNQMQVGNPVAMIAKSDPGEKNLWWWTEIGAKRIFGVGLPKGIRESGPVDCLLIVSDLTVNDPNLLAEAATFSQYLEPPELKFRMGELDRNFPGDRDNDGMVEEYGFQAVRMAHGRAVFTIVPGERPLMSPAFLLTVPPGEREAVDLRHSHVLINVDGRQYEDPPQWPDGSFLWQYPGVLTRSVVVEVTLERKE
jgi:hypothetical protein